LGWVRTETFADADADAEEAAGSEEIAARIDALKVPTISSSLVVSLVPRLMGTVGVGTYVNLAE